MRIRNAIFTALVGTAVLTPVASAQGNNQSDVSGVSTTTFTGTLNVPSGTSNSFTPAQTSNVQQTVSLTISNLISGSFSISLPASVAQTLLNVLNGTSTSSVIGLKATLGSTSGDNGSNESENPGLGSGVDFAPWPYAGMGMAAVSSPTPVDNAADELVDALTGLFSAFTGMDAGDIEIRPTERLIHAVDEFNEFVDASSYEMLLNPPIEFLAIRAILTDLVNAADATDDVGVEINDIGEVEGQEDE